MSRLSRLAVIFYNGNEFSAKLTYVDEKFDAETASNADVGLPEDGLHTITALVGPLDDLDSLPDITIDGRTLILTDENTEGTELG